MFHEFEPCLKLSLCAQICTCFCVGLINEAHCDSTFTLRLCCCVFFLLEKIWLHDSVHESVCGLFLWWKWCNSECALMVMACRQPKYTLGTHTPTAWLVYRPTKKIEPGFNKGLFSICINWWSFSFFATVASGLLVWGWWSYFSVDIKSDIRIKLNWISFNLTRTILPLLCFLPDMLSMFHILKYCNGYTEKTQPFCVVVIFKL